MDFTLFWLELQIALFHLTKRTPFAYLAVAGAVLIVLGALTVYLGLEAIGLERRFGHGEGFEPLDALTPQREVRDLQPGDWAFKDFIATIPFLENGYYVFLAGVLLLCGGLWPFIAAASR